jgi:hypothetical protein
LGILVIFTSFSLFFFARHVWQRCSPSRCTS